MNSTDQVSSPLDLITGKDAIELYKRAGYSERTFRTRVQEGRIHKYLPEGRQRGAFHLKQQVLTALAEERPKKQQGKTRLHQQISPAHFRVATPADMPVMADLLESFFGAKIKVAKRTAWIERNPECAYVLCTHEQQQVVGCAFVMPHTREKIENILARKVQPPTRPEEILLLTPGTRSDVYLRSFGVIQQGFSKQQRAYWAYQLVNGLKNVIIGFGARGVIIERVYAQGDTLTGKVLLQRLGFTRLISPPEDDHANFVLDLFTSGTYLATQYRAALPTWVNLYAEE